MLRSITLVAGLAVTMSASAQVCNTLELGRVDVPGVVSVRVADGTAFLASNAGQFLTCDVSDPVHPLPMATMTVPELALSIAVHGDTAYLACGGPGGIEIIDVRAPWAPVYHQTLDFPVADADVSGETLYVVDRSSGASSLLLHDISDPLAPASYAYAALPASAIRIAVDWPHAYITMTEGVDWSMATYDIRSGGAPVFESMIMLPFEPAGIAVDNGVAVIGSRAGLEIAVLDVSNPAVPRLAELVDIGGPGLDVEIAAGKAFVVGSGVTVLDVRSPDLPRFVSRLDTLGPATSADLSDTMLYVADETGLVMFDVWTFLACTPADQTSPFGQLSGQDVGAFAQSFVDQCGHADIDGDGLFGLDDVVQFVEWFSTGCPD